MILCHKQKRNPGLWRESRSVCDSSKHPTTPWVRPLWEFIPQRYRGARGGHCSKPRSLVAAVFNVYAVKTDWRFCVHVRTSEPVDDVTLQLCLRCEWAVLLSVAALSCTEMKYEGHSKPPAQMTYKAIVLMRIGSYGDNFYFCRLYTTSEPSCRLCIYCRRQTRFNQETDRMLTTWTL